MSMIIDGTNGLTFNNATTQNSGGQVLQVVQATTTTGTSTTSTSYVSTALTASITPKFSTSKILCFVTTLTYNSNVSSYVKLTLYRNNTTNLGSGSFSAITQNSTAATPNYDLNCSFQFLDSPATTSSTSYTMYISSNNASYTASAIDSSSPSFITLMEIAQ
jgi:hypothetical protein